MSSSGKGQSVIRDIALSHKAWQYAQEGSRAGGGGVIVEGFIPFDYEITLLTISAVNGIHFVRRLATDKKMAITVSHGSHKPCPMKC